MCTLQLRADGVSFVQDGDFEQLVEDVWGTNVKVEVLLRILGLSGCRNTVVGGPLLRGVSGGEKKRVTSAEHLVEPKVRYHGYVHRLVRPV